MSATSYALDQMGAAYDVIAAYASVHTSDPSDTGANEAAGVARQAITWSPDGTGVLVTDPLSFTIPGAMDLTHVGIWTAVTGGHFVDAAVGNISFGGAGLYVVTLTHTITAT